MSFASLAHITAEAVVPEQLVHYVRAVSGRRAVLCRGWVAYIHEDHAVLVAYPPEGSGETAADLRPALEDLRLGACLAEREGSGMAPARADNRELACSRVTVLAPFRPAEAPETALGKSDSYWQLPVPAPAPGAKLRNMLARAGRELRLEEEDWSPACAGLLRHYLQARPLPPGTRAVFEALPRYLGAPDPDGTAKGNAPKRNPGVVLLAARRKYGELAGFSVGDFSGLRTAFYMFSFRRPDAPPGTADALLAGLLDKAQRLGHERMNLGLGINGGIGFFKRKWGAIPFPPYVETSWALRPEGASPRREGGLFGRLRQWIGA